MVRPATSDDALDIAEIYAYYVSNSVASFEEVPVPAEEMRRRIEHTLTRYPFLVYGDGRIEGYAYAGEHRSRASYRWSVDVTIYLRPEARRMGIGSALYRELLKILRQQRFVHAYAGITLPNDASVGLHRSLGFEAVGSFRSVGFKFGRWHDTFWMAKELQAPPSIPDEPIWFPDL
jgi:phosphinothricin acetyltransferase